MAPCYSKTSEHQGIFYDDSYIVEEVIIIIRAIIKDKTKADRSSES